MTVTSSLWLDRHMTTTTTYSDELNAADRDRLDAAASKMGDFGVQCPGVKRYSFYRRKGYCKQDALSYTFAWLRNIAEQYERRLGHDTGAEGWRAIN